MERQRFRELRAVLRQAAVGHRRDPACTHDDATIVLVQLWAVLHDRPTSWAVVREHWPGDLRPRAGLPSQSCMSRRLRSVGVLELIQRFEDHMRAQLPDGDVKLIDGRPLPTGGCSKDPDAATGYGAGHRQRGYKLHIAGDLCGAVDHWHVTAMNGSEQEAAALILPHLQDHTVVTIGDGNDDVNHLYDQAQHWGTRWLAQPHRKHAEAPGHRQHHPDRLASWAWVRSPAGARLLRRVRSGIERINAWQGQAAIGLGALPHHVRRGHRVRVWVALKLIIYHHWLHATIARRHAA